jgi:hypothetical protein
MPRTTYFTSKRFDSKKRLKPCELSQKRYEQDCPDRHANVATKSLVRRSKFRDQSPPRRTSLIHPLDAHFGMIPGRQRNGLSVSGKTEAVP